MKSPYEDDIEQLRRASTDYIDNIEYISADECFDKLSKLYLLESILYSRVIDEESNEEIKKSLLENLMIKMTEWKMIINLQKKYGEPKSNLGRPCNKSYGLEEFYLKLKGEKEDENK